MSSLFSSPACYDKAIARPPSQGDRFGWGEEDGSTGRAADYSHAAGYARLRNHHHHDNNKEKEYTV